MHLRLNEFFSCEEHKNKFNGIILAAKELFNNKGDSIAIEELNEFQLINETRHIWLSPLSTKKVIKVLDYLHLVVNDEIAIVEGDEINYEF